MWRSIGKYTPDGDFNMKQRIIYLLCVLLATFSLQCKKENMCDCIKRTGDVMTERREVGAFTDVYAKDNIRVVLVPDSVEYIDVEAGEHLIPLIKTEVVSGELQIRNDNRCNFTRSYDKPINVYIHMLEGNLHKLVYEGTKSVTCTDTFHLDSLNLEIMSSGNVDLLLSTPRVDFHQLGVGDLTLQGRVDDLILYILGPGFVTTDELENNYTWIYTRGTGRITCAPTNSLTVTLEGYGSVYYRNTPVLDLHVSGTGGVFPF